MRIRDWSSDVYSSDLDPEKFLDFRKIGPHRRHRLHRRVEPLPHLEPLFGIADGRLEQIGQGQLAPFAVRVPGQPHLARHADRIRSEARRVGKEWCRTFRSWWSPSP